MLAVSLAGFVSFIHINMECVPLLHKLVSELTANKIVPVPAVMQFKFR